MLLDVLFVKMWVRMSWAVVVIGILILMYRRVVVVSKC